jgi:type II secretory pathway component PulJ
MKNLEALVATVIGAALLLWASIVLGKGSDENKVAAK